MGLFDFFKPQKITDSFFGELTVVGTNKPERSYEGTIVFKPTNTTIEVLLTGNMEGATPEQQTFFLSIEDNYPLIKTNLTPLIVAEFSKWGNDFVIKDFDNEFSLESLTLPDKIFNPAIWELCYTSIHDKDHWIMITLKDSEPVGVMIDG